MKDGNIIAERQSDDGRYAHPVKPPMVLTIVGGPDPGPAEPCAPWGPPGEVLGLKAVGSGAEVTLTWQPDTPGDRSLQVLVHEGLNKPTVWPKN